MAISFVGAASGTTSATVPKHVSGDLLVAFAYRDGSTTAPTVPTGWTSASTGGASTNSSVVAYQVGTGSTVSGTWTNASHLQIVVYRGASGIGAITQSSGASTTVTYPALTLTGASPWVAIFGGHRSVNTTIDTGATGTTVRATRLDATCESVSADSAGVVASWSAVATAVGGTSSGWRAASVEIIAAVTGGGTGFVGVTTGAQSARVTSATAARTGVVAGNSLLIAFAVSPSNTNSTPSPAITDSTGNSWAVVAQSAVADPLSYMASVTYLACQNATAGTHTLTVSLGESVDSFAWAIMEFSPGAFTAGAENSGGSVSTLSIGPQSFASAGIAISAITEVSYQSDNGMTVPSGWTSVYNLTSSSSSPYAPLSVARIAVSAGGSATSTWTWTTASTGVGRIVSWIPSATLVRALTVSGGTVSQLTSAQVGTGMQILALVSGAATLVTYGTGTPLVYSGGYLRTLASGETLEK